MRTKKTRKTAGLGGLATRHALITRPTTSPPPPSAPKRRSARAKKAPVPTAPDVSAAPPDAPTTTIVPETDAHDHWCCSCADGGTLRACSQCPRVVCYICVVLPHGADLENTAVEFICPRCHLDRNVKANTPYTGLLMNNMPYPERLGTAKVRPSTLRGNYPRLDTSPLGVVNIRLKNAGPDHDPAILVYLYLRMYFTPQPNALVYTLCEFDITPKDSDTLEAHQHELDKAVAKMESAGCRRVLVFVHTHSSPANGDLHVQTGSAITADSFLKAIFGSALTQFAARTSSMLIILSCGGLYSNPESFDAVGELASQNTFGHILGFGGHRFLPHLAVGFLLKLASKFFIERFSMESILPQILGEEEGLGAHSTVLHLTHKACMEWAWYHSQARPQGIPIGHQCPTCGRLRSLKVRYDDPGETTVLCKDQSCGSRALSIPRNQWRYNCEEGMKSGSGWAYRTVWRDGT